MLKTREKVRGKKQGDSGRKRGRKEREKRGVSGERERREKGERKEKGRREEGGRREDSGGGRIFLSAAGGQVGSEVLLFGLAGSGNPFGFVKDAECSQVHYGGVAAAADNLARTLQNSH